MNRNNKVKTRVLGNIEDLLFADNLYFKLSINYQLSVDKSNAKVRINKSGPVYRHIDNYGLFDNFFVKVFFQLIFVSNCGRSSLCV